LYLSIRSIHIGQSKTITTNNADSHTLSTKGNTTNTHKVTSTLVHALPIAPYIPCKKYGDPMYNCNARSVTPITSMMLGIVVEASTLALIPHMRDVAYVVDLVVLRREEDPCDGLVDPSR